MSKHFNKLIIVLHTKNIINYLIVIGFLSYYSEIRIGIRISFIAKYVYTYKKFVLMTEATAVRQNDSDGTGHK